METWQHRFISLKSVVTYSLKLLAKHTTPFRVTFDVSRPMRDLQAPDVIVDDRRQARMTLTASGFNCQYRRHRRRAKVSVVIRT